MKELLLLSLLIGLISGCASKGGDDGEEREFKPTYQVRDAQYKKIPGWLTEPQLWAQKNDEKDAKDYRYFVSSTELVKNQRLCLKSAEAQAAAKIAGEITQFVKDSYAQAMHGEASEEAENYMDETLAQEIQSFIVGVEVFRTYWENRAYKVDMGADEDKTGYICSALLKMKASTLKQLVDKAAKKIEGVVQDTEAKKKVQDALKDVSDKFEQLP